MKTRFFSSLSVPLLVFTFIFSGCENSDDNYESNKNQVIVDMGGDVTYHQPSVLVVDEANPSNHYSRIDSVVVYGYGFEYFHPDSLKNCDLKLIVSGKMRETESITSNIAISVENMKDSLIFWRMLEAKNYISEPNKWVNFIDSLVIPASSNPLNAKKIKVFSSKGLGKGFFDVDNVRVEFKQN